MADDTKNMMPETTAPGGMPAARPQPAPPQSLLQAILGWPLSRKLALLGVAALCGVIFGVIIYQARMADYQVLFANLNAADASSVVDFLKERKMAYRLDDGGKDILVPADKVYELRLSLAGSGLPTGGGVGFEIFDRQSFGLTDFAQKVNYRRALQGELARTIASLAPVEAARVHLALPEKRLFRDDAQPATASVIIKLANGGQLKDNQIQGIVHLVSGSVEGLEPENVTVVDATGRVLTETRHADTGGAMSPGMLDFQKAVELRLEQRGQSLLDRAVGVGNAMVRVTAQLDFSQKERVEESYDPNAVAVRTESAVTESSTSESNSGIPGVQSNVGEGSGTAAAGPSSNRTEETSNYEISKVVSKQVDPMGAIKMLSVSVLVGDKTLTAADGTSKVEARSADELKDIEQMIRSALGLTASRGDQLSVVSMPFETGFDNEPLLKPSPADQINQWLPLIKYSLLGLGALLAYLLLVKPMLRSIQSRKNELQHEQRVFEQYRTVEELEQELSGTPLLSAPDDFVGQIRREITKTASTPTQVVKSWLNEG